MQSGPNPDRLSSRAEGNNVLFGVKKENKLFSPKFMRSSSKEKSCMEAEKARKSIGLKDLSDPSSCLKKVVMRE